jgi:hypothetical protein
MTIKGFASESPLTTGRFDRPGRRLRKCDTMCRVGEVARRVGAVVRGTASGAVSGTVAAVMASAGIATGDSTLVQAAIPTGALAGALTEQGSDLVQRTLYAKADRIRRFMAAAAAAANKSEEELLGTAAGNEAIHELLNITAAASANAHDDWKIRVLAGAFARGAEDPAVVDEMLLAVEVLRQLEVPHVRLLRVLANQATGKVHSNEAHKFDPGLRGVPMLIRTLFTLGLLDDIDPGRIADPLILSDLGRYYVDLLARLGADETATDEATGQTSRPR